MKNLIKYVCDKNIIRMFIRYKFQRKGKIVNIKYFIKTEDVIKYNLYKYCEFKYNRYRLTRLYFHKLNRLIFYKTLETKKLNLTYNELLLAYNDFLPYRLQKLNKILNNE